MIRSDEHRDVISLCPKINATRQQMRAAKLFVAKPTPKRRSRAASFQGSASKSWRCPTWLDVFHVAARWTSFSRQTTTNRAAKEPETGHVNWSLSATSFSQQILRSAVWRPSGGEVVVSEALHEVRRWLAHQPSFVEASPSCHGQSQSQAYHQIDGSDVRNCGSLVIMEVSEGVEMGLTDGSPPCSQR